MIGVILFIIVLLSAIVWFSLEFKRFKHRIFAVFFVILLLFLYFSGVFVFKDTKIDFKSVPGIISAAKVYFTWLFSIGGNFGQIVTNAIKMNWSGNITSIK